MPPCRYDFIHSDPFYRANGTPPPDAPFSFCISSVPRPFLPLPSLFLPFPTLDTKVHPSRISRGLLSSSIARSQPANASAAFLASIRCSEMRVALPYSFFSLSLGVSRLSLHRNDFDVPPSGRLSEDTIFLFLFVSNTRSRCAVLMHSFPFLPVWTIVADPSMRALLLFFLNLQAIEQCLIFYGRPGYVKRLVHPPFSPV